MNSFVLKSVSLFLWKIIFDNYNDLKINITLL